MAIAPRDLVLIVEDDDGLREMLARALIFEGFNVRTAQHGLEAARWIEQTPPAALVLDIELPWMDGTGVLFLMRQDPRTRTVPVVVITGTAVAEADLQSFAPVRLLRKPFPPDELLALIRQMVSEKS